MLIDGELMLWQEYENAGWPARYLFDGRARLFEYHYGEGAYAETELAIQELLGVEREPLEPLRPEDEPGALLAAPTQDREGAYSGPYEAGGVWVVFDGPARSPRATAGERRARARRPGRLPPVRARPPHERASSRSSPARACGARDVLHAGRGPLSRRRAPLSSLVDRLTRSARRGRAAARRSPAPLSSPTRRRTPVRSPAALTLARPERQQHRPRRARPRSSSNTTSSTTPAARSSCGRETLAQGACTESRSRRG